MEQFLELAKARYSVRKYKPDPVEQEKIDKIVEAGLVCPTAHNYQPQKIYVIRSEENRKKLAQICTCTFDAPLIFAIGYDETLASKPDFRPTGFGETDAAIVCTQMMLEAADLGLGACWVGMFVNAEVKKVLDIPENITICNLLPVGYAAENAHPSRLHSTFRAPEEIVFER